jgi:hypothetical protein
MLMALGFKPGISHYKSMIKCSAKKGDSTMELSSRFLGVSTFLSREQEK